MSFNDLLAELPALSVAERQVLIRRALELDDPGLSPEDEEIIAKRLQEHRQNPNSAISLDEMNSRLDSRFSR